MAAPPPVRVLGAPRASFDDAFHKFLQWGWPASIAAIALGYLGLNVLFAAAYFLTGGIANARPGSFADAFYFSVQTMGTIGYGAMSPASDLANLLVVAESVTGLLVTSIAAGLVFAKFARTPTRVAFGTRVAVAEHDGVATLMVRVGNRRQNRILDARFGVTLVRTEVIAGAPFYRMYDLTLVRSGTSALTGAYLVMHRIVPESPLWGYTPEALRRDEVELHVTVAGFDDTTLQPVHAVQAYDDTEIVFDHRFADMMHIEPDGTIVADLRRFDALVPVGRG
jgi:inward rectifier potassium channel